MTNAVKTEQEQSPPGFFSQLAEAGRTLLQIAGLCVILLLSGWVGWQLRAASLPEPARLPSIVELQEMVGATPDGRLGRETEEKWNRAICDQYAAGQR